MVQRDTHWCEAIGKNYGLHTIAEGGTKYGARQVVSTRTVDWGAIILDVDDDGACNWDAEIIQIEGHKAKVVKL